MPENNLSRLCPGKTLQSPAGQVVDWLPVDRICRSQVHREVSAWSRRLFYAAKSKRGVQCNLWVDVIPLQEMFFFI